MGNNRMVDWQAHGMLCLEVGDPCDHLSGKEIHALIFINFVSYCCDCKSNKFSDN